MSTRVSGLSSTSSYTSPMDLGAATLRSSSSLSATHTPFSKRLVGRGAMVLRAFLMSTAQMNESVSSSLSRPFLQASSKDSFPGVHMRVHSTAQASLLRIRRVMAELSTETVSAMCSSTNQNPAKAWPFARKMNVLMPMDSRTEQNRTDMSMHVPSLDDVTVSESLILCPEVSNPAGGTT